MMRQLYLFLLIGSLIAVPTAACAATIDFDLFGLAGAGLLPDNDAEGDVTNGGTGGEIGDGIFYDTETMILTVNVGWGSGNGFTDLSGDATNAHIHGPADINTSAGVLIPLTRNDSSASGGFISGTYDVSAANEVHLLAGNTYINIHTALNGPGEIRGNLIPIPEPASIVLLSCSLLAVPASRRRRAT